MQVVNIHNSTSPLRMIVNANQKDWNGPLPIAIHMYPTVKERGDIDLLKIAIRTHLNGEK